MRKIEPRYLPHVLLFSWISLNGCVEQYYPAEDELKTGTLVVMSQLTDKPGKQSIRISRSSTIVYPEFDPISDCFVVLESMEGKSREFSEVDEGTYTCDLDAEFLNYGGLYRITILTKDGAHYESTYEAMYPSPAVDGLYFEKEVHATSDPKVSKEGVRFYMDFEIEKYDRLLIHFPISLR